MRVNKLIALIGLMANVAHSATFGTSANAQANAWAPYVATVSPAPVQSDFIGSSANSAQATNEARTSPYAVASSSAYSIATPGALSAYATSESFTLMGGGTGNWGQSIANAQSQDSFVLVAKGVTSGTHGTMTFQFLVDGSMLSSGVRHEGITNESKMQWTSLVNVQDTVNNSSYSNVAWNGGQSYDNSNELTAANIVDYATSGTSLGLFTYTMPVIFGSSISVNFSLSALAETNVNNVCQSFPGLSPCSSYEIHSTTDFSHSLAWGGIVALTDDQGHPITNFLAKSADTGFNYANSAVPVPASAWLFGSGLIGLIATRRKLRHQ